MWLAALWSSLAPASAADAPEFLLGNVDVRIDLPPGWAMTRWSDDDFSAKSTDGGLLLFAWSTPIQTPVAEPAAWAPAFTAKVEELSGKSPAVASMTAEEIGGRRAALVDVGFAFGDGNPGKLFGAVVEIPGRNFFLATIAPQRSAKAGDRARRDVLERMDWRNPPPQSTFGAAVKAGGVETRLPADFRPARDDEWSAISGQLAKLGREDYTGCWTAIRPRPMAPPDVLATCPAKVFLGVVDEHSFATADAQVREKLFGKGLDPGTLVPLPDRIGFLYAPRDGLAMGAVPQASGMAVTWGLGEAGMADAVRASMTSSTWDGPHPAETNEVISYWLTERTFSPQVLCPALGCVGLGVALVGGVGAVVVLRSRGRKSEDEE